MSSVDEKVRGDERRKGTEQEALENPIESFCPIISFSSRLSLSGYTSGKWAEKDENLIEQNLKGFRYFDTLMRGREEVVLGVCVDRQAPPHLTLMPLELLTEYGQVDETAEGRWIKGDWKQMSLGDQALKKVTQRKRVIFFDDPQRACVFRKRCSFWSRVMPNTVVLMFG